MSLRAAAAWLVVALVVAACGDQGPAPVATLVEGQGSVSREHEGKSAAAPNGQPFVLGDAARTGTGAWARLQLRGGPVLRLGADTRVRFVAGGARLEVGEAEAETAPVTIVTEAGAAIIEPGGRVRAGDADGNLRFEVIVGRAVIQREDGPLALDPGGGVVVAIGGAIVERIGTAAPEPTGPPTPTPTAPTPAPATTITATVRGRGATAKTGADPARPLPAGPVTLAAGDTVKLPRGASLELARGADRATATGPAELTIGDGTGALVTQRTGTARASARDAEVAIAVPGGVIVTRPGGDAALAIGRNATTARVERGAAALDGDVSDATAAAGETGLLTRAGAASIEDATPTAIDVALPPGGTATIHDPGRKVAVRIDFGCADGTLDLADRNGSFTGARRISGTAASFFVAGTQRYRLRCDGNSKSGTLRVAGDTGAAAVVRTAQPELVEIDGRKYTLNYQNRLPEVTIRWADARGATTLELAPGKGAPRTFSSASGTHVLPPGTLADGVYTVTMIAGTRRSRPTTVRVAFDNAAPTAQITAPSFRAEWTDPLVVTGVTVEGWSVEVDGAPADRDGSGRFRASVPTAGKSAFWIRLAHPQHGVHYYLRRRR